VKLIKIIIYTVGVLTILWIFSTQFELKDPNGPRIIDPSQIAPPRVDVKPR